MFGGNNPPTGTGSTTKPSGNESKIEIYSTVNMRKIVVNVVIISVFITFNWEIRMNGVN